MDRRRVLALTQEEHDHQPQFFKANHDMHAPRLLEIAQELATGQDRLAAIARDALAALDDLIQYCDDPSTAALGARYNLAQELLRHPAPDAPHADPEPAALALVRDRIAAEFAREDAHHWGYDHGFEEKYGADPETDAFVDIAVNAALGAPLLSARATQER